MLRFSLIQTPSNFTFATFTLWFQPKLSEKKYFAKQRIKVSRNCFLQQEAVPAGVPLGMKLGPWVLLIITHNLSEADTTLNLDYTSLVKSVSKNETSYMQLRVDELVRQVEGDGFRLSESKCKELRISFSRSSCGSYHYQ